MTDSTKNKLTYLSIAAAAIFVIFIWPTLTLGMATEQYMYSQQVIQ